MHKFPRKQQGFTLIEVLIVIFIISIATTMTLLSIGKNENREIETFAKEVTQMVSLAEEQAMLEPHVMGISLQPRAIQFASLNTDKETQKKSWLPMTDHALNQHAIPSNIQISLHIAGNPVSLNATQEGDPQIIISTNGDITPFVMYIGKKGKQPLFAITADADGNITKTALS